MTTCRLVLMVMWKMRHYSTVICKDGELSLWTQTPYQLLKRCRCTSFPSGGRLEKLIKKKEDEEEWRRMQFELFKKEDEEAHWHEPKPEPEGEWCFNGDSRGYDGLCAASAFVPPDMSATRHTMSANEVVYVVCSSQCLSII